MGVTVAGCHALAALAVSHSSVPTEGSMAASCGAPDTSQNQEHTSSIYLYIAVPHWKLR